MILTQIERGAAGDGLDDALRNHYSQAGPLLRRHIYDMPFIEAAFAHSAPQLSELERTMCFAHGQVSDLAQPHLSLHCVKHIVKFPDLAPCAKMRVSERNVSLLTDCRT